MVGIRMSLIRGRWRRLIGGGAGRREIVIEAGIEGIDYGRCASAELEGGLDPADPAVGRNNQNLTVIVKLRWVALFCFG